MDVALGSLDHLPSLSLAVGALAASSVDQCRNKPEELFFSKQEYRTHPSHPHIMTLVRTVRNRSNFQEQHSCFANYQFLVRKVVDVLVLQQEHFLFHFVLQNITTPFLLRCDTRRKCPSGQWVCLGDWNGKGPFAKMVPLSSFTLPGNQRDHCL